MSQAQYYPPPPTTNGNLAYLPTGYQQPQYYPQPAPQDPLEQLAKTVRLLDYIKGRESPSAPAQIPQQQQQVSQFGTPGAGNVAQFAPYSQATLDQQQQAMGLAQASGVSAQPNAQPWQQVWGQAQPSNNLEARQQQYIQKLEQLVNGLQAEIDAYQPIAAQLPFWLQVVAMKDEEINDCWAAITSLAPFVDCAQIWAQDAEMHRQLLYSIWNLYNDPGHLVYQAFQKWSEVNLTEFDLNTISELFLHLLEWQNQKNRQAQGQVQAQGNPYVPQPQQYNPQQSLPQYTPASSPPFPPIPGGGLSNNDPRLMAINIMRQGGPEAAKTLQRMRMAGQL